MSGLTVSMHLVYLAEFQGNGICQHGAKRVL